MDRVEKYGLQIDAGLHRFLVEEAMPGTGVDADRFFSAFSDLVHDLGPKNRALLVKRDELQASSTLVSRAWCPGRHGSL